MKWYWIALIVISIILIVWLLFKVFNKNKSSSSITNSDKPSEAQLLQLYNTANSTGTDMFEGVSFEEVKQKFIKLTSNEVNTLIMLINKGENNLTSQDAATITYLIGKVRN